MKGQIVDISGFEGYKVSITTSQLCHYNEKNKWTWIYPNKTLFTKSSDGLDLAHRPCLLTAALELCVTLGEAGREQIPEGFFWEGCSPIDLLFNTPRREIALPHLIGENTEAP